MESERKAVAVMAAAFLGYGVKLWWRWRLVFGILGEGVDFRKKYLSPIDKKRGRRRRTIRILTAC